MNRTVIALGFFDGVHRGHGALLEKTAARARELEAVPAAFTFDRPPKEVVTGRPVGLINTPDDRRDLMQRLYGIRQVIIAPFDRAMMTMPWQDFIDDLLIGTYGAVHLVAGHDYHFGHRNQGNPDKLLSRCRERGIGCDIIPQVTLDGITVSSTYIRTLVESGQMERAADFLGHRHCLTRTVTHGCRFGRTIGIPTVNLTPPDHVLLPERGVYVTRVFLPDGTSVPGVTTSAQRVDELISLLVEHRVSPTAPPSATATPCRWRPSCWISTATSMTKPSGWSSAAACARSADSPPPRS